MDELTIEADYLRRLILKMRALMGREQEVIPDSGDNPTDDDGGHASLQDSEDDLTREEIIEEFEGLDEDQLAQLVTLMWIGRGDAEAEDWDETLQLARDRREGDTIDYLLDHPLVGDYWADGLDKLGHGARVLESGEY